MEEKEYKVGYLEENKGEKSMMRLMCITSLWMSFFYGCVTITVACFGFTMAVQAGLVLAGAHIVGAFVPKAIQKFAENENFFLLKK